MSKFIETDKLLAEIERLKEKAQAERVLHPQTILSAKNYLLIQDYDTLLSIITSLQQEQPEVELERELCEYYNKAEFGPSEAIEYETHKEIARHFYELGLNARKEE